MRPDNLLNFKAEGGRVLIQAASRNAISFIGASLWSSAEPSFESEIHSFAIGDISEGQKAVAAIIVRYVITASGKKNESVDFIPLLLDVTCTDGKIIVDKDNEWSPSVGVKVRMTRSGLEAVIDDDTFTTFQHGAAKGKRVVDGNVLCRYLVNPCQETADAVREAASQVERQKSLEERVKELETEVASYTEALADANAALDMLQSLHSELQRIHGHYHTVVHNSREKARRLQELLEVASSTDLFAPTIFLRGGKGARDAFHALNLELNPELKILENKSSDGRSGWADGAGCEVSR